MGYKSAFDRDGVKYLVGSWSDSNSNAYSSLLVQVPGSQLILELVQKTSLSLSDGQSSVEMEQRVPDNVLAAKTADCLGRQLMTQPAITLCHLLSIVLFL